MVEKADLAASDIDRSYIGGVERGQRNLSFKKLCSIAWGCRMRCWLALRRLAFGFRKAEGLSSRKKVAYLTAHFRSDAEYL